MSTFEIKVFDDFDEGIGKFLCNEFFSGGSIIGLSGGSTPKNIYQYLGKNCPNIGEIQFLPHQVVYYQLLQVSCQG